MKGRANYTTALLLFVCLVSTAHGGSAADDTDVSGPIVKLSDVQVSGQSNPQPDSPANATAAEAEDKPINNIQDVAAAMSETAKEVAREVDKALIKEFGNGTETSKGGESFAAALGAGSGPGSSKEETGKLETVVRISGSSSSNGGAAAATSGEESESNSTSDRAADAPTSLDSANEHRVDRIIDQHDNEFVLSRPGSERALAVLTLDPQLVTDLTVVLVAAAALGAVFEGLGQPTINGYLIAGAMVGPGGLKLVQELVQVESVAQLGVYLLLFGLGMELNLTKIRSVLGVSIIGGSLQILLAMIAGGALSAWLFDAPVTPGVFTGALLAMSSTSVVVKCLEATKSMHTIYGTITVGTLILQDIWVGLLFALMPIFKPQAPAVAASAGGAVLLGTAGSPPPSAAAEAAAASWAAAEDGGALLLGISPNIAAGSGLSGDQFGLILEAVFKVLFRIALFGGLSLLLARVVLARPLRLLVRHGSTELNQIVMVGVCLGCTWAGGRAGISEELGAFLGGIMVSAAAASAAHLAGPPLVLKDNGRRHGGSSGSVVAATTVGHHIEGGLGNGFGATLQGLSSRHQGNGNGLGAGGGGVAGSGAKGEGEGLEAGLGVNPIAPNPLAGLSRSSLEAARLTEELQHALRHNIDSVHNVMTTLFIACTSIIISPRFLLQHARVLAIGTVLVMGVKTLLVAGTVSWFGHSWRLSLAVGVTMSHVGEFAFVLLSTSVHLNILPPQVYQLLLGVTALSLLATPLVIIMCSRLLREPLAAVSGRLPLMADASSPDPPVPKIPFRWFTLTKN